MKNSILGKARWLREVALATSKNNGARVAREWLKYAAMFVMLFTIGVGNVWGEEITYTFSSKSWAASPANWTSNTDGSSFESSESARGVANNGVNGACTSPITFANVSSISIVASSNTTGGKVAIKIGDTQIANKSINNKTNATYTYNSDDYPSIANLSGNVQIVVTKPTSKSVWVKSITITYSAAPAYTITATRNNDSYGTVEVSGTTITATPAAGYRVMAGNDGYTVTSGSATVVNNGDNTFTVTPSSDCTVRINFESKGCTDHGASSITGGALSDADHGPLHAYYDYSTSQILYTKSDLDLAAGKKGTIKSIYFEYSGDAAMAARTIKIYMANTDLSSLTTSNYVPYASFTQVYSGTFSCGSAGWYEITLDTPFDYNGAGQLAVMIDDNTNTYERSKSFKYHSATGKQIYKRQDDTDIDPASWTPASAIDYRPNTKFCIQEADMTPATVTLMDNGATITEASAGAGVTLPSRAGCAGYTFAGWTKTWVTDQTEWTTTAPTIIPAGSYTPTANENLYPVYTKTEDGGGEPVETKTQTFQYDTWEYGGSSTDKSSYRLFHDGGYVESASDVDFSKLSKVIVYGGTFGGTSYNGISIKKADGTLWKNATVSGSKETGTNTITGGASLTGSAKLRVYSTKGTASGTGVRISKVEVYTMEGGTTTSYISVPNCCTPLGTINGSINVSQLATPDPTKLKASWAMNAETGIASYTLEVYDSSDNLVKTINNYTSGSEITGLTPCTEYYVKLYTVSSGGEYCDGGLIGTSGSCTTNGYTLKVNKSNVSLNSGSEPTNICGDVSATYAASAGYTLPTSISVTNAGAENTGWTWNSSTGVLTINKASVTGNVTVTITGTAQSNFPNNKTIFIQAHSTSAWTGGGCVMAWFHSYGGSETAQPTYWLFDAGGPDEGKKLFAAIVPTTGDLPYLDIQRFAANCSDWWNKNGGCSYSDAAGSNTIRSEGSGNDQVYWNASGVTLSLYGDPNSWASSLGTFADQGAGIWTATYNNYAPANAAGETQNFKISTNYNGWIGNTGSNNNATLDDMHVGSTYNITATLDVKDHSLTMSKTFVKGTVHFDLQGHGSAISDLTNVAAGSKISAPSPAPIVTGWDFGGWYKEPACTNAWNFASDVVNETMTLYAKWTKTPVEELLLNYSELNKYVGDPAVTLEVTGVTPEGADPSVTWSSSNSSVASVVAATGVVTFGTVGTATITATSTVTGTTTAYCHVTVRNKPTATFVDLIHDGNGTDLSTYNMQNVAGTAIVFPTLDDYATPGDDCDTKHYVFVGWTTSDNNDDPQDHLVASGELEDGQDKVFYAVWADGVEGVSYTKLTTNSFKTSPTKYVIGAEYNGDTYYFYDCAATDANNGNGGCTTSPATNAPIQFTLSGTADALVATSTEAPARYLTPLTGNNFQMSATTKTIALSENGDILNASTTTWALRFNTSNKYLRWYNTAPGSAAYFYEVTAGAAVNYRTSCCTNNVPAPTVIATNTAYTVTLTWAAVDGATGYEVSWNGGAFEAATSPCVKSGLTASMDYIYKVRATYDPLVKCGALVASGNVTTDDVYSVTYSGGTGTGSCSPSGSVAPVSYEAGATVTLAPTNSFSMTSNTFAAWVVKDAENNDVAVSNNQFTMPASNVTVTATWTAVQDKYYDRMHQSTDASHGGIADGNGKYYIVREGCNYTVPSPADDSTGDTDCHTTHFKLLGWIAQSHLKSDGSIKDGEESYIFQGGTIKSATGATYYAVYAIMTE